MHCIQLPTMDSVFCFFVFSSEKLTLQTVTKETFPLFSGVIYFSILLYFSSICKFNVAACPVFCLDDTFSPNNLFSKHLTDLEMFFFFLAVFIHH